MHLPRGPLLTFVVDPATWLVASLPWVFAAVSLAVLSLTVNALWPVRRHRLLLLPSFLAGTVAGELAGYVLFGQLVVATGFVFAGTLHSWVGWVAVAASAVAVVGLAVLVVQGFGAVATVREALTPLLGRRPRPVRARWRLLIPFPLRWAKARITRNVVYARVAGQRLRLDVYHPAATGQPRPAVIHVHGGGWTVGDKREQGVPLMTVVSDRGFVGFNVNYRLSPAATWPDHLIDVKRAIAWVRAHADEYGVDTRFIGIAGGSAGGHLATMAALTPGDRSLQPGFEDADTHVDAVASFYAIYDLVDRHARQIPAFIDMLLQPLVIKAFLDEEPARFSNASPLDRVVPGAPPFFVLHGDRDTLAPLQDARDFVAALAQISQAPVVFAEFRGAQHSFDFFVSPRSLPILEGVAEFFEHFAGEPPRA